ncbi:MAG TPA: hypothetical protein VHF69_14025, partial [Candidatus Synoicihabitans sp.]|nr:hypothetical protein [Candidatus Synoicihabitans sp.]
MAKPYDPFAASVGAEYLDPAGGEALTSGARSLVAGFGQARAREAKRDPLKEEMTALSRRKTDLGRVSEALKNQRTAFMDSEGADLFERDPLTGRAMIDETTKKPIDRIQTLRTEMIEMRARAGQGDVAAQAELPIREKEFKLKLDKWNRLQSENDRVTKAALETENRLGELANQRLYSPQPSPLPGLGQAALSSTPSPISGAAQPQPHPHARPEASDPRGVPFSGTSEPVAAQPAAPAADDTIASLIDLHQRVKTQEGIMADGRTSEQFKAGAAARATEFRRKFADGMAQLDAAAQQRVTDAVRDPTFMEQLGNFAARAAEGAGSTLVDAGEFVARNAARGAKLLGADIDPTNNAATQFAEAMRSVAAEWGPDVAQEVQAKLDSSLPSALGQGVGSAAAFMAPGMLLGRLAKVAGMSDKAAKVLVTSGVAGAGAGATGNTLRREAEANLGALVQAGEITADEFQRGVNQAEAIGALVGTSEIIPLGKFAERLSALPGGQSFVNGLFRRLATEGVEGASKWVRGAGREALHRVGRAAGEGFEEALQEFGQSAAENLTASGSFGNVGWDPDRATFSAEGSEQAGIGFIVGALLGAATGGRVRRDGPDTAPADPSSAPTPSAPEATPGDTPPQMVTVEPGVPAPTAQAPTADDVDPELDEELLAELRAQFVQPPISAQPAQEGVSVEVENGAVAEEPAAPALSDDT